MDKTEKIKKILSYLSDQKHDKIPLSWLDSNVQKILSEFFSKNSLKNFNYENTICELPNDINIHNLFFKKNQKITKKAALIIHKNIKKFPKNLEIYEHIVRLLRDNPREWAEVLNHTENQKLIKSEIHFAFINEKVLLIEEMFGSWFDDDQDLHYTLQKITKEKLLFLLKLYPIDKGGYSQTIFGYCNEGSVHEAFLKNGHQLNKWAENYFSIENVDKNYPNLFFHALKNSINYYEDDNVFLDIVAEEYDLNIEDNNGNELLWYFVNNSVKISKYLIDNGNSMFHSNNDNIKPVDILEPKIKNYYINNSFLDLEPCHVVYVDYESYAILTVEHNCRKVCNFIVDWYNRKRPNSSYDAFGNQKGSKHDLFTINEKEELYKILNNKNFNDEIKKFDILSTVDGKIQLEKIFDEDEPLNFYINKDFEISEFLIFQGCDPFQKDENSEMLISFVTNDKLLERYLANSIIPYTVVISIESRKNDDFSFDTYKLGYGSYEECENFISWFEEKKYNVGESFAIRIIGTQNDLSKQFPNCTWIDNFWEEEINYDLYEKYAFDKLKDNYY